MKQSKRLIMNDEILAIDPGREKTGIAILKNSDVLEHKIINSEELVQIIKSLLEKIAYQHFTITTINRNIVYLLIYKFIFLINYTIRMHF